MDIVAVLGGQQSDLAGRPLVQQRVDDLVGYRAGVVLGALGKPDRRALEPAVLHLAGGQAAEDLRDPLGVADALTQLERGDVDRGSGPTAEDPLVLVHEHVDASLGGVTQAQQQRVPPPVAEVLGLADDDGLEPL
ncbi:hypothetical protein FE634_12535 [Nocardioides dongxiaopingii]|uniref:hypothetical protein n=1 Tax=Nocardioides sp. S-1144 TaxID=2582905 RepID=UPI00110EB258|nr:hypothetical protein [Nocardioides sp. S-1144]QCW51023.1 hypothetical protein FE634_12535 [Nocardioides sp. S-1144]